ncbi:MAG TPA: pyrimidine dimer DNA glycosylase/endonuclease V [Candidatus Sumerlaeota bacterium]|nr:pyrimidine dimer DNA glycosylase/endonuclease V [Candidatus Sumerlaeota bacterium]HPS00646.1 pyrimidine dimer DNA glycosylase/endonuclease V [Candidatus Sumerlaeota bacterium]
MRLWSLHPRYLDPQGLVALWREALLAQKVLRGETHGYRHHPQLIRFQETENPLAAIATYLAFVQEEATRRGYSFQLTKIHSERTNLGIAVTAGQLDYEWNHLLAKLRQRAPDRFRELREIRSPLPHPLFFKVTGEIANWERI